MPSISWTTAWPWKALRALKLWFVMRYFGRDGLIAILRENIRMATWLGEQIAADDRFDLAAPVAMGLVCFRLRSGMPPLGADAAHQQLWPLFCLSHSSGGRFTIRAAIGNIRTRQRDVEELWIEITKS